MLDVALAEEKLELSAFYEVQRSSTAVGLVAAGVGIAVVPRLAWQVGSYPRLRMLALTSPTVTRTFSLLTRRGAELSPSAQTLYEMILRRTKLYTAERRTTRTEART